MGQTIGAANAGARNGPSAPVDRARAKNQERGKESVVEKKELNMVGVLRAFFESPRLTRDEIESCPGEVRQELAELAAEAMGH